MADAPVLDSSSLTRIIGSDAQGSELTPIGSIGDRLKSSTVVSPGNQLDIMGRPIVSSQTTVFNSILARDKQPQYWDEQLIGAAASTYNSNSKSVLLSVGTASGDKVIRQTFRRFLYLTGQGTKISWTANLNAPKTNLRQRIGYFDENDGIFLQTSSLDISLVVRNSSTGSLVETTIPRSSWDDPLDGTGSSGVTIDFTKKSIFSINFAWQGAGNIRFGVFTGGEVIYFHNIDNSNINSTVYMRTPNLPIRMEIENIGITASASTLTQTCATLEFEGAGSPTKIPRSVSNGVTTKSVGAGADVPVISMRVSALNVNTIIEILLAALYVTGNNDIYYRVVIGGTLTGAVWTAAEGYIEIDTTATAITGGTTVGSGYIKSGTSTNVAETGALPFANNQIGKSIAGATTIITLTGRAFNGNARCYGVLDYLEI